MFSIFTRSQKEAQRVGHAPPTFEMSDDELLGRYQETGDQQMVAALLDRYADLISIMSMRYLKDEEEVRDFAMDLYLHLVKKLLDYEVENFKAWLCRTVTNRLKDLLRKRKVRENYKQHLNEGGPRAKEDQTPLQMDLELLKQALERLSEKERRCVEAVYFQQMSYDEASELLGWTPNQVRGTRDRAIGKLRKWLGQSLGQYFAD